MHASDAVAEILKREGINILPSFPTTAVIEAAMSGTAFHFPAPATCWEITRM